MNATSKFLEINDCDHFCCTLWLTCKMSMCENAHIVNKLMPLRFINTRLLFYYIVCWFQFLHSNPTKYKIILTMTVSRYIHLVRTLLTSPRSLNQIIYNTIQITITRTHTPAHVVVSDSCQLLNKSEDSNLKLLTTLSRLSI